MYHGTIVKAKPISLGAIGAAMAAKDFVEVVRGQASNAAIEQKGLVRWHSRALAQILVIHCFRISRAAL